MKGAHQWFYSARWTIPEEIYLDDLQTVGTASYVASSHRILASLGRREAFLQMTLIHEECYLGSTNQQSQIETGQPREGVSQLNHGCQYSQSQILLGDSPVSEAHRESHPIQLFARA